MASYRRRGKTWTVYWYATDPATGERKQRSKGGFRTKGDATAWHIRNQSDTLQGFQGAPDTLTVTAYMNAFLDSRPQGKPSPGTLRKYRDFVERYMTPYIGATPIASLDSFTIQRWHNRLLERPLSPRTIQHIHALLSSALGTAVDNGMLHRNACRLVSPPVADRVQRTRLDSEQIKAFLKVADTQPLGLLYRTALFTLMRPGELLTLRWSDLDIRRSTITVQRTRTRNADGQFIIGKQAKTAASHRTIVIHDDLLQRLRAHKVAQNTHRLQYAELWTESDLVFCRDDGSMIRQTYLANSLTRACKTAGVPRVTPHELRHSGASLMVELNENLKTISERLGHRSIALTADVYLGVSEGLQRQASERLARAIDG